jgi:hypothetical protein
LGGYLLATRRQGLSAGALRDATGRMFETLGVALVFLIANVALGVGLILGWRALTGVFLSVYYVNDVALVLLSLVQGLIFRWWQETGGFHAPSA